MARIHLIILAFLILNNCLINAEICTDCRYVVKKFLLVVKNYTVITEMNLEEKFEMLLKRVNLGHNEERREIMIKSIPKLREWFVETKEDLGLNVEDKVCIPEYCCEKFHFGEECQKCDECSLDGGFCDGSGLKKGTGKCKCRSGYYGEKCEKCNTTTHYEILENDGRKLCRPCNVACSQGCKGPTDKDCEKCAKGFILNEGSCLDVDECANNPSMCDNNEAFCKNTPGSFECKRCDSACKGCYQGGSDNCIDCAPGYEYNGTNCVDIDECEHMPCEKQNEVCVNLPGYFKCKCAEGFEPFENMCVKQPSSHPSSGQTQQQKKKPKIIWTVNFFKEFSKTIVSLLALAIFTKLVKGNLPVTLIAGGINTYYVFAQSKLLDVIYNNQK